jgi:hypothetical protein
MAPPSHAAISIAHEPASAAVVPLLPVDPELELLESLVVVVVLPVVEPLVPELTVVVLVEALVVVLVLPLVPFVLLVPLVPLVLVLMLVVPEVVAP